jgi:hypothetical protein
MIICPVCETENKDDAIHCECCGERLAPLQPGEQAEPETMLAAQIATPAPAPEAAPRAGFAPIEDEFEALLASSAAAPADDDAAMRAKLASLSAAIPAPAPTPAPAPAAAPSKPAVLYSPLNGRAYAAGTPEYADGFGPLGEELVAEPPANLDVSAPPVAAPQAPQAPALPATQVEAIHEVKTQPMQAVSAPPVVEAPAPAPAPRAAPAAKITVFHQRQPVHTHLITTDEILIGRRDVRADIHPDIDLTTWDPDGNISRKHVYIYRQNRLHTIYAVSNGGVQLNKDLLEFGDRRELRDGDVIILAGVLAMKFETT